MQILVIGYYGFGNVGDDICLAKTKDILNSLFVSPIVWILSADKNCYPNAVNRWNFFSIIKTIVKVDMLVFGGGGILQNKTSHFSLWYYLGFIFFAKCFNKKVFFLSQGIGPIRGIISKFILSWILMLVTKTTLRSQESSLLFKSTRDLKITSDLAFYKAPLYLSDSKLMSDSVGLNFCDVGSKCYYSSLVRETLDLGLSVVGLSFCSSIDTPLLADSGILKSDIKEFCVDSYYQPSTIQYYFIVAMRYHSCVWSILQGIPFIALAYDDKVLHLANYLNQPVVSMDAIQSKGIIKDAITTLTGNFGFYQGNIVQGRKSLLCSSKLNEWVFHDS
tara:strand:- start:10882 stop:11880 length:999 start_codon:yes stop_codon:yes gene_type:complete